MGESFKSAESVRDYLLGRVSDEATLEAFEELLFTDEEFCARVEVAEDELINDYVLGYLDEADAARFKASLEGSPERGFKVRLAQTLREKALAERASGARQAPLAQGAEASDAGPSFLTSLKAFFGRPLYAGAFAALLVAALAASVYLFRGGRADEMAELRAVYGRERPNETRASGFGYAPLAQTRGEPDARDAPRLRRFENDLLDAAERTPDAHTRHTLGVFYLMRRKYPDAVRELEAAAKLDERDARIHNDLGSAYFETAKASPREKRLEALGRALEEFTRASESDAGLLEALFNKSLALQELGLRRQAKESWTLYLEKDPSSQWADEARKHLARLDDASRRLKTDERALNEEVLRDFLDAYRARDEARARQIHDETKGMLRGAAVFLQLSRRHLAAKLAGDIAAEQESLAALAFVGDFERARHDDLFFSELADFHARVGAGEAAQLMHAKDLFDAGQRLVLGRSDYLRAVESFEASRDLFEKLGDAPEAGVAEVWAAQLLPDVGRPEKGRLRLAALVSDAERRSYKVLLPPAYYWLGISAYGRSALSRTGSEYRTALRLAEAGENAFEVEHAREALALFYSDLGETVPALAYASGMLRGGGDAPYYRNSRQVWRDLGTLAVITLRLNLPAASLAFASERLAVAKELSPEGGLVNWSLRSVVNAAEAKGDYEAASKYANESLRLALANGDTPENARMTAELYLSLADVKARAGDCDGALNDYGRALELYGRLPELSVSSYQIRKGRLLCFRRLGRREEFAAELRDVLKLSERYRATIREDSSRQAFFANEQGVFDAAADEALESKDPRAAFVFVEESRARSLLEFVKSGRTIAEVESDFASVARPLSLAEIQAGLPEQAQLVQYAVLPDRLAVWVLTRTRFDYFERAVSAAELERKVEAYRDSVISKAPADSAARAGHELYDLLVPPGLDGGKQLCVVADKSLHRLPFASLVSPSGKYLLEEFALSHAPSASVFVLATANARGKAGEADETLLAVGDPDFDREENPNLSPLRSAADEAKGVAGFYTNSLRLLGGGATKDAFLRDFRQAEVIHFAGHFVANRQSPANSKLLFAGGDLRSYELGGYRLTRAKVVALSACQTGVERYDRSEGAVGVARTFLALGAPLVVASGWEVDSEPTKDLMVAFHRNRKERGLTSAESLRRAQLELSVTAGRREPFYWAAFSLFGGYAEY
ncbi:MAG TPA: CHAT domain-containing protein [Pyrinomonadaceae bacterium]